MRLALFNCSNGLRDVPTFMINMVAQWGNLVLYYEMPSWFESWDALDENDSDPVDVKALKVSNSQLHLVPPIR